MTKSRLSILVLLLVVSSARASWADVGLLRTSEPLDEARGYCLDIAGFGPTLRLDDPLQAHTCKYGGQLDDQRFERIASGAIKASLYDRCLAATGARARGQARGARVHVCARTALGHHLGPSQPRVAARSVRLGRQRQGRDRGHAGAGLACLSAARCDPGAL